jgi:hypothetical protein
MLVTGDATVDWEGTNLTTWFHFKSDPGVQVAFNGAAYVGRERNGEFFWATDRVLWSGTRQG